MRALILQTLERPTLRGRQVLVEKITGREDNIIRKAQDYISERMAKEGYIRVTTFDVKIYDHRGKFVTRWKYSPTYR
jgi:hypothetical protein